MIYTVEVTNKFKGLDLIEYLNGKSFQVKEVDFVNTYFPDHGTSR